MLSLSSTTEAASALRGARSISLSAYTLRRGVLFDALEAAARGGARVSVLLEGAPGGDTAGGLARANASAVAQLRAAGVGASLSAPSGAMIHAKELDVDGALYLDDRNWGGGDLVIRDDDAHDAALATHKRQALAAESTLLRACRPGEDAIVESESFGCCNAVYSALDDAAKRGLHPRVLVCARELHGNSRERSMLQKLVDHGARVRVTSQTDKLALAGRRAWIGSANATAAIATPDTIDWSTTTTDPTIVNAARNRVEANWESAKVF